MHLHRILSLLQIAAAGGIVGASSMGAFFDGANIQVGFIDLKTFGALVGATLWVFIAPMAEKEKRLPIW